MREPGRKVKLATVNWQRQNRTPAIKKQAAEGTHRQGEPSDLSQTASRKLIIRMEGGREKRERDGEQSMPSAPGDAVATLGRESG